MDSRTLLAQRIDSATQKDVLLGIFFESSLDHVLRSRGQAALDAIRAEVFQKKNVVSFFRYPVADLLKMVDLSIPKSARDEEYDSAGQEFGRAAVRHFFDSPVGKTMSMLAGRNPHRLISSAPSGYKAVTSFGERTYVKIGERAAEVSFAKELLGPAWQVGVFKQALESVCEVKADITVRLSKESSAEFVLAVTW